MSTSINSQLQTLTPLQPSILTLGLSTIVTRRPTAAESSTHAPTPSTVRLKLAVALDSCADIRNLGGGRRVRLGDGAEAAALGRLLVRRGLAGRDAGLDGAAARGVLGGRLGLRDGGVAGFGDRDVGRVVERLGLVGRLDDRVAGRDDLGGVLGGRLGDDGGVVVDRGCLGNFGDWLCLCGVARLDLGGGVGDLGLRVAGGMSDSGLSNDGLEEDPYVVYGLHVVLGT